MRLAHDVDAGQAMCLSRNERLRHWRVSFSDWATRGRSLEDAPHRGLEMVRAEQQIPASIVLREE